jgi:hypothetical protein
MRPGEIAVLFDEFLQKKGLQFEAVVIGGSALALQKVIERETIDIDCLDPKIPSEVLAAAEDFRIKHPELLLIPKWLNNGPESLLQDLPADWRDSVVPLFTGKAVRFFTLGREDLLKTKLFAYCDRGDDFKDCIALKPSINELNDAIAWVSCRDTNPYWPEHVRGQFDRLKKALKYE